MLLPRLDSAVLRQLERTWLFMPDFNISKPSVNHYSITANLHSHEGCPSQQGRPQCAPEKLYWGSRRRSTPYGGSCQAEGQNGAE